MDSKILLRIDSVLKHIDLVLNDVGNLRIEEIENNSVLLRATCFSVSQIGEIMNKLEKDLIDKYPNLPWLPTRNMRNLIIHDYDSADVAQIYSTIHKDLPDLKNEFIKIRQDIIHNS